jgi:ABC-2 type transport system permease protein
MPHWLLVLRKDLTRFLQDPLALFLWFCLPLVVGGMCIVAMGGRSGPAPKVHLLVADEEDNPLTRFLLNGLGQAGHGGLMQVEKVDRQAGQKRMENGEASAFMILPKGFTQAVLNEEKVTVAIRTNPAQYFLPRMVVEGMKLVAEGHFYLHRILGQPLKTIAQGPAGGAALFDDNSIANISMAINQAVRGLEKYLVPPVLQLEAKKVAPKPSGETPIRILFLPGFLFMGILFAAQGIGIDIWKEQKSGVLQRVFTTPVSLMAFLGGKILAGVVVAMGISLTCLTAGMLYLEIPLSRLPLATAWAALSGLLMITLMLAIVVFATSERVASVLSFSLLWPLMMLGGSMFPLEVMPRWMSSIGRWTPNGWAVGQLKLILAGKAASGPLAGAALAVLAVSLALLILGKYRIQRSMIRS